MRASSRKLRLSNESSTTDEESEEPQVDSDEDECADGINRGAGKGRKRKQITKVREKIIKKSKQASVDSDNDNDDDVDDLDDNDKSSVIREAGQVRSIVVENFMCHHKFKVDFCNNVTFVTGQNGSGKSAIVAALQLCLGGTAKNTGRGSNLASLIREGSEGPAVLTIRLRNEGPDAYKPDEYGNRIIVQRRIHKTGGSDYALYGVDPFSRADKLITRERDELDKMLTQFNICVNNPCCVLTQEDSKRFINGKEKEKYDFFLKATGLQEASEVILATEHNLTLARDKALKAEEQLGKKRILLEQQEAEMKEIKELLKLEDDIKIYKAKVLWYDVYTADADVMTAKSAVEKKEEEYNKAVAVLKEMENISYESGNMDEIKTKIEGITTELNVCNTDSDISRKVYNEKSRELNGYKNAIKDAENQRNELIRRSQGVQKEINDLQEKALADSKGNERQYMEKLSFIKDQITQTESDMSTKNAQKIELVTNLNNIKRDSTQNDRIIHNYQKDIQELQRTLTNLTGSQQGQGSGNNRDYNRQVLFGREIPDILQRMSMNRFQGTVYGPLGLSYIQLKDGYEKYQLAIEKILERSLTTFLVTNTNDQKVMTSILRELNCARNYHVSSQYPCTRHNVPSTYNGCLSIMDCITVENDVVFNYLVDALKIDQVILADSNEYVQQNLIKYRHYNGRNEKALIHDNMKTIILINGDTINYVRGNENYTTNKSIFKRLLAKDMNEIITYTREELTRKQAEITQYEDIRTQFTQQYQQYNTEVMQLEKQLKDLGGKLREFMRKKSEYENELNEIQAISNIDTSDLEAEHQELLDSIHSIERQIDERKLGLHTVQQEVEKYEIEKNNHDRKKRQMAQALEKQEQLLQSHINNIELHKRKIEKLSRDIQDKERQKTIVENQYKKIEAERNTKFDIASTKTLEYIPTWDLRPIILDSRETIQKLNAVIQTKTAKLQKEKELAGIKPRKSLDAIITTYEKSKMDYEKSQIKYDNMVDNINNLIDDITNRQKQWKKTLKKNSTIVRKEFLTYQKEKGFKGDVLFDHIEKTLQLLVQTDGTDQNTLQQDVRGLSGGERSYTTFCLLLALGRVIECPFKVMDEYDVFLDEASRKRTLDMLLQYAKMPENSGRQFFVITPHTLVDIEEIPNVIRIHHLKPPKRASKGLQQGVLSF